jgi:hypothetical protein
MKLSADYLDRGLTPHLLDISQQGLRAKFMRPVFPVSVLLYHFVMQSETDIPDFDFSVSAVTSAFATSITEHHTIEIIGP